MRLSPVQDRGQEPRPETHHRLIRALAASRLYNEAVMLAECYGVGEKAPNDIKDILTYGRAMLDLKEFLAEQYRLYFGAQASPGATLHGFAERLCALWSRSSWAVGPCPAPLPFDPTDQQAMAGGMRVIQELGTRFGMVVYVGGDGADLAIGHAITAEPREIDQHGKQAKFTYYLLDEMIANGWPAWATDRRSEYGGWLTASGEGYAQVRQIYVEYGVKAWLTTVFGSPHPPTTAMRRVPHPLSLDRFSIRTDSVRRDGALSRRHHPA